ncbi:MAG: hypothetical protein K8W52_24280 [Deltaproteobacteria bacterium]|nr:hypothetical protein [Deltaproteobacteria bacterium]
MPNAPALDIASLTIEARELVVSGRLTVPGAELNIYAQSLEFDDSNGLSAIDLTPLPKPDVTTALQDAEASTQSGPAVSIAVSRVLEPPNSTQPRIIARGATGQRGGPERKGQDGLNLVAFNDDARIGGIFRDPSVNKVFDGGPPLAGWPAWFQSYNRMLSSVVYFKRGATDELGHYDVFPGNGHPGEPGGKPAPGGDGGKVVIAVDTRAELIDTAGGAPGAPREAAPGGAAGEPKDAVGIWIEERREQYDAMCGRDKDPCTKTHTVPYYHFKARRTSEGDSTPSPTNHVGGDGVIAKSPLRWLRPGVARATLQYAEDLYRAEHFTAARQVLDALSTETADAAIGILSELAETRQQANTLRARLLVNLDYYGHRRGWVPSLDFVSTIQLLQAELKSSAVIMAVSERIRLDAETGVRQIRDLQSLRDAALQRIVGQRQRLQALSQALPALQSRLATSSASALALTDAIAQVEQNLHLDAADRVESRRSPRRALHLIAALAQAIPVGQPAVGGIGKGLDLALDMTEQPWDAMKKLPSLAESFSTDNVAKSVASYKEFISRVDSLSISDPKALLKSASEAAEGMSAAMTKMSTAQERLRAPESEIEAEFQKIKTEHPQLTDLVEKAQLMSAERKLLAEEADNIQSEIGAIAVEVTAMSEQVDSLNASIADKRNIVDHEAITLAADMGHRIRNRLEIYHYYAAKAYQYYSLQPYPGSRRVADDADKMRDFLARSGSDPKLAAEAYAAAYEADIRGALGEVATQFVNRGASQLKPMRYALSEDQLESLNKLLLNGSLARGMFISLEDQRDLLPSHFDARLVDVAIADCVLAPGTRGGVQIDVDSGDTGFVITPDRHARFRYAPEMGRWGAVVESGATTPRQISRPLDVGRVMAAMTGGSGSSYYPTAPPLLPGVWLHASKTGRDSSVRIDRLVLDISYSYRTDVHAVAVHVVDDATAQVPIWVSASDRAGLQHGIGSFTRVFDRGSPITFVAPGVLGALTFDGWYVDGERKSTAPAWVMPTRGLDEFVNLEPRYRR